MFIYLASTPVSKALGIVKIGSTLDPKKRLFTYLTGCPPGLTPSQDIEFDAIWETNTTIRRQLYEYEDEVLNHFRHRRLIRERHGDSEWFSFIDRNPYDEINKFMESRHWFKRKLSLSEIISPHRPSRYLRKIYDINPQYINTRTSRDATLNILQEPVITAITEFMTKAENKTGYVIAPCGSGKTVMTSKGIRGVKKCIICCPSMQIQNQWMQTLIELGVFNQSQIHIIGGAGTTDSTIIRNILVGDAYCIITTYMSSHLLTDTINEGIELLVLDEAHHMAGIVAEDNTGEGRTRRLMLKASDIGIKRLSLTYTPRYIADDRFTDTKYLTMDDDSVFGKSIAELKIRDLINSGVLPDYRLWTLSDEAKKGTGITGKAECILEAWGATKLIRSEDTDEKLETFILHHLIIFASSINEAKYLEQFFKDNTTETLVLRVEDGDKVKDPISQFTSARRAILVNCKVLNEGVDIPIANAVAITYPKQSRGQITQMILRAGRWYEGKAVFHVLLPILDDGDLSGFEEVLYALASNDDKLRDEIELRSKTGVKLSDPLIPSYDSYDTPPECIMIEEYEANLEDIKRCFTNIRKSLFHPKQVRELCINKGVNTSVDYALLRANIPELPEDPRPKNILWYDYLHPNTTDRLSAHEFINTIIVPNNISSASRIHSTQDSNKIYEEWREQQSAEYKLILPTVQHINDGFFGKDYLNFNSIITSIQETKRGNRRGR